MGTMFVACVVPMVWFARRECLREIDTLERWLSEAKEGNFK